MDSQTIRNHLTILSEELMPALGCTEPIAVAYAAAKVREVLGTFPEVLQVHCSGNIIKNVKSVTVPNSNGLRGIDAAASEARMAGCSLPAVINSGSGNQGITVSVPVIVYAQSQHYSQRKLYRALAVSNLVSIHLKYYIGDLSAFCGAVTSACGAGAALAYLDGGDYGVVSDTISNTLACVSGIFCDGAKPSCAAKVTSALNAAFLAFRMARKHRAYNPGEGVVGQDVEQTIHGVGLIGREGMEETDQHILRVMLQSYTTKSTCHFQQPERAGAYFPLCFTDELFFAPGAGDGDFPLAPGDPNHLAAFGAVKVAVLPVFQPVPELHELSVLLVALIGVARQGAPDGQDHQAVAEQEEHHVQHHRPGPHGQQAHKQSCTQNHHIQPIRTVAPRHKPVQARGQFCGELPKPTADCVHNDHLV